MSPLTGSEILGFVLPRSHFPRCFLSGQILWVSFITFAHLFLPITRPDIALVREFIGSLLIDNGPSVTLTRDPLLFSSLSRARFPSDDSHSLETLPIISIP